MITVRPYTSDDITQWDAFIDRGKNATFLFKRGFMEYHANRFTDHSLMLFEEDRLVALLPASRDAEGTLVSHGGLTYGGMVTQASMTVALALPLFEALLARARNDRFVRLHYQPVPYIYHRLPADEDLHALFLCGAQLVRSDVSSTIALRNFKGFSKSKRAGVKAAAKAGIVVAESRDFDAFWGMLAQTLDSRHSARPTHSLDELDLLASRFPVQIRLFLALLNNEPCAGIIVFDCGPTVHTQYIASTPKGREVGAADAIVAKLLHQVYADREWFDFGISTVNQGRDLNVGLSRQKEMYGARTTVYQHYLITL